MLPPPPKKHNSMNIDPCPLFFPETPLTVTYALSTSLIVIPVHGISDLPVL